MRSGNTGNTGAQRSHPTAFLFRPYNHLLPQERHPNARITRPIPTPRPTRPNALVTPDLPIPPLLPANNIEANGTAGLPPPLRWISQVPYVPARIVGDFTPAEPVSFSGNGVPGILVSQAVVGGYAGLDGRDDGISSFEKNKAICRIQFTGFSLYTSTMYTRHNNAGWTPITRCKLAKEVGRRVKDYIEERGLQEIFPLERVYLTRLTQVSKGSWQPELILFP